MKSHEYLGPACLWNYWSDVHKFSPPYKHGFLIPPVSSLWLTTFLSFSYTKHNTRQGLHICFSLYINSFPLSCLATSSPWYPTSLLGQLVYPLLSVMSVSLCHTVFFLAPAMRRQYCSNWLYRVLCLSKVSSSPWDTWLISAVFFAFGYYCSPFRYVWGTLKWTLPPRLSPSFIPIFSSLSSSSIFFMPLLLPSTLPQGLKMKTIRHENVARWYTNYLVGTRLRVSFSV